jgi:eukaryotic-like serine/threonine-protein kinase
LSKSIPLFEDLLQRQEANLTRDHGDTLLTIANLGVNYSDDGQFDKGIPLLEEAYRKAKSRAGSTWIGRELRIYYERAGKPAQAVKHLEDELAAARKQLAPNSVQLADALMAAGKEFVEMERYAVAEPVVRECLVIYENDAPGDAKRWSAVSVLGEALRGQKKYADAEPLLLQSYEGMKRHEEKSGMSLQASRTEALERLIQLYKDTGSKADAAKWQAELVALKKASASKDK